MAYISKSAEDNLVKIIDWCKQPDINKLICADEEALIMFVKAEVDLIRLRRARKETNAKTWAFIKERRETDRNYGR